jgi:hypothetical protein
VKNNIGDITTFGQSSQYAPLVIVRNYQNDMQKDENIDLMIYEGEPNADKAKRANFKYLPSESIIEKQANRGMKAAICITGYNESYKQLLESISGSYRAYHELLEKDQSYYERVTLFIVYDGYEAISKVDRDKPQSLLNKLEKVGLYSKDATKKYINEIKKRHRSDTAKTEFVNLSFMNKGKIPQNPEETKEEKKKETKMEKKARIEREKARIESEKAKELKKFGFETNNIAHWFSRSMNFEDFMAGLTNEEKKNFKIDGFDVNDFVLGSSDPGQVKTHIFSHVNMEVHFVIKHLNRMKIESHLWFFKGL